MAKTTHLFNYAPIKIVMSWTETTQMGLPAACGVFAVFTTRTGANATWLERYKPLTYVSCIIYKLAEVGVLCDVESERQALVKVSQVASIHVISFDCFFSNCWIVFPSDSIHGYRWSSQQIWYWCLHSQISTTEKCSLDFPYQRDVIVLQPSQFDSKLKLHFV